MMVVVVVAVDHSDILTLLPVPHQQHDGRLMEVLEIIENENYEGKMKGNQSLTLLAFLSFFLIWQGFNDHQLIFDVEILLIRFCSD